MYDGKIKIEKSMIPCAVLENGTRLLTQQGFLSAIGRSKRPKAEQGATVDGKVAFLAANNLKPFIDKELWESTQPIIFRTTNFKYCGGSGNTVSPLKSF